MTEPAEVVQKIALSVLEKFGRSEAAGSLTVGTPILSAFLDLWVEVKSPEFLTALQKNPDVAALASKEQLEAERKLVVELSRKVEALNGTVTGLMIELQREQEKLQGEQDTSRQEQLKLRAELEGKVAARNKDELILDIGSKAEGMVSGRDFEDSAQAISSLEEGDKVMMWCKETALKEAIDKHGILPTHIRFSDDVGRTHRKRIPAQYRQPLGRLLER